jgi:hypothetical protein
MRRKIKNFAISLVTSAYDLLTCPTDGSQKEYISQQVAKLDNNFLFAKRDEDSVCTHIRL